MEHFEGRFLEIRMIYLVDFMGDCETIDERSFSLFSDGFQDIFLSTSTRVNDSMILRHGTKTTN